MKVKSMKKAVAMACALGMIVTSGAVPGSILTAEASTSWTWSAIPVNLDTARFRPVN